MKRIFLLLILILPQILQAQTHKLWYDQPSGKVWERALPVGNGFLGAMVYGNPDEEILQLNETTLWSGSPFTQSPTLHPDSLAKIRKLIFEGQHKVAEAMAQRVLFNHGSHGQIFQPAGSLHLRFTGHDHPQNYYRELDISRAVQLTRYKVGEVTYTREVFASHADRVVVVRISSDQKGKIDLDAFYSSPHQEYKVEVGPDQELIISGNSSSHEGSPGLLRYRVISRFIPEGGQVHSSDTGYKISGADVLTVHISIATNYNNFKDISADEKARALGHLQKVKGQSFTSLLAKHIRAYQKYYQRVELNLDKGEDVALPTDKRLENFRKSDDPDLAALYFQYGRYLLISSSQPGGQPANLQGIWNHRLKPSWDSKYTININTEMNYWPAERTALSEMHRPLFAMVKDISETGKATAKNLYGAGGWVAHHNTDLWRITWPVDAAFYGMWTGGGAWLTQHLWEHFLYSGDLSFLKENYDIIKGAAQFYADFLVQHPDLPWLVINPGSSPENAPEAHKFSSLAAGATMDNQLVFDTFNAAIFAAEFLKRDTEWVNKIKSLRGKLPPMHVGKHGQLQEWLDDVDSPEDKHRHVSHLYGLFPSAQISPYRNPELFSAAKTTLLHRGDVSTGWSMGWKVNWWARLKDGDHAYTLIRNQLTPLGVNKDGGGTYPNLFDAHPPFQIDGNFGCTAGIAEMLVQSGDAEVEILPALPQVWKNGTVKGLRTVGGFVVEEVEWKDGKLVRLVVKSELGGNLRLRLPRAWAQGTAAKGENPNPYFVRAEIAKPVISPEAKITSPGLPETYVYDVSTVKGRKYSFVW
jgi:alpha-L-fucosidase 2